MREIDNLIRLFTLLLTFFGVYILITVLLTILKTLDEIKKIFSQYPSTFTPFNPESFIIGFIIVGIIALILKAVTD